MNITLFEEAISYVCKINRIIKFSRGHGMLVGEGGAGRHSLTKLATFIAKYNLCQVTISKGFKLKEFREKIKEWSQECAFKDNSSAVFMFSDNQISEESFVEDINTILTIGEIPNLFGKEDMANIK
jgi:dynein heavy chain